MWTDHVDGIQVVVSEDGNELYNGPIASLDEVSAGVEVAAGDTHLLTYVCCQSAKVGQIGTRENYCN